MKYIIHYKSNIKKIIMSYNNPKSFLEYLFWAIGTPILLILFMLAISGSCNAQTKPQFTKQGDLILPKEQIRKIADTLRKHELCEPAKQALRKIVRNQSTSFSHTLDSLETLRNQREELHKLDVANSFKLGKVEGEKRTFLENRWLWFGIGCVTSGWVINQIR